MFGDSIGTDPAELVGELSPISKARHILEQIAYELSALQRMIDMRREQIADLEKAGVYDAEPMPAWENRNGFGRYLRLIFPTADGRRRRVYVGNDPEKIAAALAQIERTRQYRLTRNRLVVLTNELSHVAQDMANVNGDLAHIVRVRTFGQT